MEQQPRIGNPYPAGRGGHLSAWTDRLLRTRTEQQLIDELRAEHRRLGAWWRVAERIGEALDQVGLAWQERRLSVVEEHVFSESLYRAIVHLGRDLSRDAGGPVCWFLAVEGDEHTLGLLLAELCAREVGWQTTFIGHGAPLDAVQHSLQSDPPSMVAASASIWSSDPVRVRRTAVALGEACEPLGIALVLGGTGAWPEPPAWGRRLNALGHFHNLLAAWV